MTVVGESGLPHDAGRRDALHHRERLRKKITEQLRGAHRRGGHHRPGAGEEAPRPELIFNTRPVHAYLMEGNSLVARERRCESHGWPVAGG
jgi:hypothetical protein